MDENFNPLADLEFEAADVAFKALDRAQSLEHRLEMALDLAKGMFANVHYIVPGLMWFDERGTGMTPQEMSRLVEAILTQLEYQMSSFEAKYPEQEGPI